MRNQWLFLFGGANAIALLVQFFYSTNIVNFFSFFTILCNILATGLFVYLSFRHDKKFSSKVDFFFGAVVTYMTLVGLVYWILLRNVPSLTAFPWINIMLHAVMPIVVILGWFMYRHHYSLLFKHALAWLIFPLGYLVYTLIHGALTHWYPYPFLDPSQVGYQGILLYAILFSVVTYVVGLGVVWLGNKLYAKN